MLIDLKCANVSPEFGGGAPDKSRPNLASIRKSIELYNDEANEHRDIVILFLK